MARSFTTKAMRDFSECDLPRISEPQLYLQKGQGRGLRTVFISSAAGAAPLHRIVQAADVYASIVLQIHRKRAAFTLVSDIEQDHIAVFLTDVPAPGDPVRTPTCAVIRIGLIPAALRIRIVAVAVRSARCAPGAFAIIGVAAVAAEVHNRQAAAVADQGALVGRKAGAAESFLPLLDERRFCVGGLAVYRG